MPLEEWNSESQRLLACCFKVRLEEFSQESADQPLSKYIRKYEHARGGPLPSHFLHGPIDRRHSPNEYKLLMSENLGVARWSGYSEHDYTPHDIWGQSPST